MLTYGQLKDYIAIAESKGLPEDAPVRVAANSTGIAANVKEELGIAVNIRAGHYTVDPTGQSVLEAPEFVLNQ